MYLCGPTVQATPHVGHGRAAVAFDVIRRYLEWRGFEVTLVANITDIEDKIIASAAERGISPEELAAEAADQFRDAYRKLGVAAPDIEPKATEHVPEMIELIEELIKGEHAYPTGSGDVYFAVRSFPGYGALSGRKIDDLVSGARIEPGEEKRDPLDFALWKAAKPGEPSWGSPWGPGRPGWHVECSAMARKYLGDGFDIHGGGTDLMFPHHENEVAQAEAAYGSKFVRYWLHNGMINLKGEKMAKSTGLVVDLLSALEKYPPSAMRLFYLRTHYRKPVDFTDEALEDATASIERLWAFRRRLGAPPEADPLPEAMERFQKFMDDDFDTAGALAVVFDLVREGNSRLDEGEEVDAWAAAYDEILGILGLTEPQAELGDLAEALTELASRFDLDLVGEPEILVDHLVGLRNSTREAKDWARSDEIRDALLTLGIVMEDAAGGTRWHRG
jgi:cysteinyl-tRNA synthetase